MGEITVHEVPVCTHQHQYITLSKDRTAHLSSLRFV